MQSSSRDTKKPKKTHWKRKGKKAPKATNNWESIVFGVEMQVKSTNNWYWAKFCFGPQFLFGFFCCWHSLNCFQIISSVVTTTIRSLWSHFFSAVSLFINSSSVLRIFNLNSIWSTCEQKDTQFHSSKFIVWKMLIPWMHIDTSARRATQMYWSTEQKTISTDFLLKYATDIR